MNASKSPTPSDSAPADPAVEPPKMPKNKKKPPVDAPAQSAPVVMMQSGLSKLAVFCLFLILLLSIAMGGLVWWFWPPYQQVVNTIEQGQKKIEQEQASLLAQLDGSEDASSGLAKTLDQLRVGQNEARRERMQAVEKTQSLQQAIQQLNEKQQQQQQQQLNVLSQSNSRLQSYEENIDSVNQRLDAHNDRLLSLSNTSREDWLLAEAEYLLRLANQRMLVDRNARSALGLLESADNILRELAMPDLFPIRKAVADDIGALKLAAVVDREGIYLKLMGLANNLDRLPSLRKPPEIELEQMQLSENAFDGETYWQKAKHFGESAVEYLGSYVRIQDRTEPVQPLLPPETDNYLHQNIRFSLEEAQLAMLREESSIYKASLEQAMQLLRRHYPESDQAAILMKEVNELMQMPVAAELPDISGSQERLHAYIERLHKLGETGE